MTCNYKFTRVPQNLYRCMDNNCRSTLVALVQLSDYYSNSENANKEGWFFRTNAMLEIDTNLSKNVLKGALDALCQKGIIEIKPQAKGRGKNQGACHYRVCDDKFKEYDKLTFEECNTLGDYAILTSNYKKKMSFQWQLPNELPMKQQEQQPKELPKQLPQQLPIELPNQLQSDNNIDYIDNIENKEDIDNKENTCKNNMNKNISNNSSDFSIDDIILSDEDDYFVSDSELIEKYQNYILKQSQEDESHRTWEREDEGITSHNPKDFVVESAPDKEINPDKSKTSQFMGAESKEGGTSNTKKTDIAEVPLDIKGMEGFAPAPHLSKGEVESMCVHVAEDIRKIAKMDVGMIKAEDWLYERCEEEATYYLRFLFLNGSPRDVLHQLRRKMCGALERMGA